MSKDKSQQDKPEATPISEEVVVGITELAIVGLNYLTKMKATTGFEGLDNDPAKAKAAKEHYLLLTDVLGPSAVKSFKRMSEMVFASRAAKSQQTADKGQKN